MNITKICVIGAGAMGNGIAHVFAQSGFLVQLYDVDKESLDKALLTISSNIDRQIKKGIHNFTDKKLIIDRIETVYSLKDINYNTDLVIEAIIEKKSDKALLLNNLDNILNSDCIITSNTSSISITELSSAVSESRRDRFLGMHFMNPVPVIKLVEIIKGFSTSLEIIDKISKLVIQLDKKPVIVNDSPGFISNRILMPMINEAIFTLYEGVADVESIDSIMKLGMNHPMGPLSLADYIGLDVCLNILDVLYEGFKDTKYRACPLLRKMVSAGVIGKKSGKGFYNYTNSA